MTRSIAQSIVRSRCPRVIARLALLATLIGAPLAAQGAKAPWSVGASGGVSIPTGDLKDGTDVGFTVGGHVFFRPSTFESLSFRGDLTYDRWRVPATGSGVAANSSALGYLVNAVYEFSMTDGRMARPYLLGGFGGFTQRFTARAGSTTQTVDQSNPGVQIGGGFTFELSGFTTFAEVKYVNVFSTDTWNWIPITFGVRF